MMTQEELNALYAKYADQDDYDKAIENYHKNLKRRGARLIECDWKEYGSVVKEFIKVLLWCGATVLKNPLMEGSDCYGWVIFIRKVE